MPSMKRLFAGKVNVHYSRIYFQGASLEMEGGDASFEGQVNGLWRPHARPFGPQDGLAHRLGERDRGVLGQRASFGRFVGRRRLRGPKDNA